MNDIYVVEEFDSKMCQVVLGKLTETTLGINPFPKLSECRFSVDKTGIIILSMCMMHYKPSIRKHIALFGIKNTVLNKK